MPARTEGRAAGRPAREAAETSETSENSAPPSSLRIALALGTVYLVWGSTYLAIRIAIETLPPIGMAGVRYVAAGAILYICARLAGAPRPRLVHWRSAVMIGGLLLLLGNGGVVWAEQRVPSGLTALLISTEPLWIVILVWVRPGGSRPGLRVLAGMVLGFLGLILLMRPSAGPGIDALGAAAVMVASLSWAAGSLYSQRATLPASPLASTALQMLAGGGLLLLASAALGEPAHFALAQVSTRSLLALGYLIVFGALIAFTAYVWLLRTTSPVLVATYAYVNPVVAVLLGWALAGEPLTAGTLAAAAVILAGVALITSSPVTDAHSAAPAAGRTPPARAALSAGAAGGQSRVTLPLPVASPMTERRQTTDPTDSHEAGEAETLEPQDCMTR
ncbi:MAG: EamA family transporter [Acidobacteriota bacterium]|nr:EamA family transporter [Acidobacteriota bacterium]